MFSKYWKLISNVKHQNLKDFSKAFMHKVVDISYLHARQVVVDN